MTTFNAAGSNLTIHQEFDRNMKFYLNIRLTECKRKTIKKLPIWSKYYDWATKYNYVRQYRHLAGYVAPNKCAGIVTCSCNILSSIILSSPDGQFSNCATTAFSERYETTAVQPNQTVIYTDTKIFNSKQFQS